MSRRLVEELRPLHPVRVENGAGAGTPDLNYADGWVELKELPSWPATPGWPVRVPHFRPEQRVWLRYRRQRGGRAHLLLKVGSDWLLLDGEWAADHLGDVDEVALRAASELVWSTKEKAGWARLLEHLTRR